MIKRREPDPVFYNTPCSIVAVGTAAGKVPAARPEGLKPNGYLPLIAMNRYVRALLPVEKSVSFRRGERPSLKDFLETNTRRCVICVLGHYLYADGNTYWSFLKNARDPVIQVWYLKEENK